MSLVDRIRNFLRGDDSRKRPSFGELDTRAARPSSPNTARRTDRHALDEAIEPTEEFKLTLSLLREGAPFILVTGQAGTGKTTCIRWLLSELPGNVVVVAPTGLAALTAGGQTIHSFFGFPPRPIEPSDITVRRNPAIYQKLDLLIIDEISMVSCDLLDAIDRFLRINRGQRDSRKQSEPFGGVQVIALGDLFQLPPVITEAHRRKLANYQSVHFFSAKALQKVVPAIVELTQPFRQKDASFLELLRCIRAEDDAELAIDELNRRCFEPQFDDASWLVVVPTRNRAETINATRLADLPGTSRRYKGVIEGQFLSAKRGAGEPTPEVSDKNLPSPYELDLKTGARVIFTKNDPNRRWVNGSMGTVTELDTRGVTVDLDGEASRLPLVVAPVKWKKERFVLDPASERIVLKEVGSYTQLPLAPAWAITIHKVQGQTLDRVCVDLHTGAFAAGQTYVALSRCRTVEGLRLRRKISREDVRCDPQVKKFMAEASSSLVNQVLESATNQP